MQKNSWVSATSATSALTINGYPFGQFCTFGKMKVRQNKINLFVNVILSPAALSRYPQIKHVNINDQLKVKNRCVTFIQITRCLYKVFY